MLKMKLQGREQCLTKKAGTQSIYTRDTTLAFPSKFIILVACAVDEGEGPTSRHAAGPVSQPRWVRQC